LQQKIEAGKRFFKVWKGILVITQGGKKATEVGGMCNTGNRLTYCTLRCRALEVGGGLWRRE